jgi:type I restriction enzyme S subunit
MNNLKTYKFSELYAMSSGISSKPEQAGHGAPFISFSTVFKNQFLPEKLPDLMDTSDKEKEVYSVKKGDIFLTRTSETLDELGMSCVAIKDYPNASYSGFLKRLRPTQSNVTYDKFMAFYLRSKLFRKTMNNNAIMTLRASLNEQIFSYLDLILPEYKEQKKIGDLLHLINSKIELNKKINEALEAIAKLLYEYWFVQFDFPDKNGKPYKSSGGKMVYDETLKSEIPEGWIICKLGDVLDRTGTGLNPRDNFVLGEGKNYYVTIKNIKQGQVVLNDKCDKISDKSLDIINHRSDLRKGDILFTSIEPVGTTYLLREKPENWNINESVFTIRADFEKVNPEYLYMFLSGDYIKVYTKNVSAGSIHKGVRHGTLKDCKFILPIKELVDNFSRTVLPTLDKIHLIQKENLQLTKFRDWILPMLMNGQVTVGEAEEKLDMAAEPKGEYGK